MDISKVWLALGLVLLVVGLVFGVIVWLSKPRTGSTSTEGRVKTKGLLWPAVYTLMGVLVLLGVIRLIYDYTNTTLAVLQWTGVVIGVVTLLAAFSKYRTEISQTVKDASSNFGWGKDESPNAIQIFIMFHIFLFIVSIILGMKTGWPWWMLSLTITACHGLAGLGTVSEQEKGVVILFGKILNDIPSGIYFAPWPMRIRLISKTGIKIDFGTLDEKEREKIKRAGPSISWFVLEEPMRTNWGDIDSYTGVEVKQKDGSLKLIQLTAEEKETFQNDPLAKRMTTDPHLFFIMKIDNFRLLIEEVGGFDEAVERIRDVCISVLSEYAGQTFVAKALMDIGSLNLRLKEKVEELIGDKEGNARLVKDGKPPNPSWGINVTDLVVKNLGIHHDTNKALVVRSVKISDADAEARAVIRASVASATKKVNEGQALATYTRATKSAEAEGLIAIGDAEAKALKSKANVAETPGGRILIAAQAVQQGLEKGKVVFTPSGPISDAISLAMGASTAFEVLKENTPPSKAQPTPPTEPASK